MEPLLSITRPMETGMSSRLKTESFCSRSYLRGTEIVLSKPLNEFATVVHNRGVQDDEVNVDLNFAARIEI